MKQRILSYLKHLWHHSASLNNQRLATLIETAQRARILEMGCDEGSIAIARYRRRIRRPHVIGIDIEIDKLTRAKTQGITPVLANAEQKLPFQNNLFDVVAANQIIEHLVDLDTFIQEICRVLKPGGYVVIATENLSSWHNLGALALGWQGFSQHISSKRSIGNPLHLGSSENMEPSMMHVKILTLRGLQELVRLYNLKIEAIFGAGYYPFPPFFSRLLSYWDPVHSAFIGIKARKEV